MDSNSKKCWPFSTTLTAGNWSRSPRCSSSTVVAALQWTSGRSFGAVEPQDDDRDVVDATQWPHVPTISDIMVCYSTIDGYVSWRNEHNGTWFGSALAQALQNYAHVYELNHILTIASDIVHNRTTRNGAKQAIEWKYRAWTKALYFNPGYHNWSIRCMIHQSISCKTTYSFNLSYFYFIYYAL